MATVSWVGPGEFGNAYWNVGSNWSNGSVPTSSDDVIVDVSQPLFEILVTAAAAQSLAINMAGGGAMHNESTFTVGGSVTLEAGDIVNDGTVVFGGTLTVGTASESLSTMARLARSIPSGSILPAIRLRITPQSF